MKKFFKLLVFRPELPNIKAIVNVNEQNVEWIQNNLKSGSVIAKQFDRVINNLATARFAMPFEEPQLISPGTMMTVFQQYGINFGLRESEMDYTKNTRDLSQPFHRHLNIGDSAQMTLAMSSFPTICKVFIS